MVKTGENQVICGLLAGTWTLGMFILAAIKSPLTDDEGQPVNLMVDDRLWGGLLGACATFMMYYFYLPT